MVSTSNGDPSLRPYDVIVFGAAGNTGSHAVQNLMKFGHRQLHSFPKDFKWAVAGQSMEELTKTLQQCSSRVGCDSSKVGKVIADAEDMNSVLKMVAQTRAVINCTGPFEFYGRNVVEACIQQGTHLIEAAGEAPYLLKRYVEFNERAREANVYIIGACGWASLFVDSGTVLLQQLLKGELNSVESYYEMDSVCMSQCSYTALVHIAKQFKAWKTPHWELEDKICSQYTWRYPLPGRPRLHYNKERKSWHMGGRTIHCDDVVAKLSQDYLYKNDRVPRPAQVRTLVKTGSFSEGLIKVIMLFVFSSLALTRLGRCILLKFPKIFSGGVCKAKITPDHLEAYKFRFNLEGRGWSTRAEKQDEKDQAGPPKTTINLHMSGKNPFYDLSSKMMIHAVLMLNQERKKLPKGGGIYTPGAAFANTTMFDRLVKDGLSLKIVQGGRTYTLEEARNKQRW